MGQGLPVLRAREVVAALERGGFVRHHQTGSHLVLKHPGRLTLRVTVPMHAGDLKRGTLRSIVRQSGLSTEQFLDLL